MTSQLKWGVAAYGLLFGVVGVCYLLHLSIATTEGIVFLLTGVMGIVLCVNHRRAIRCAFKQRQIDTRFTVWSALMVFAVFMAVEGVCHILHLSAEMTNVIAWSVVGVGAVIVVVPRTMRARATGSQVIKVAAAIGTFAAFAAAVNAFQLSYGGAVLLIVGVAIGVPLAIFALELAVDFWLIVLGYLVAGWLGAFIGLCATLLLRAVRGRRTDDRALTRYSEPPPKPGFPL